jgi:hypothetical protein
MLDVYIIDQIRREREQERRQEGSQIPLYIEDMDRSDMPAKPEVESERPKRGSLKIDFQV